MPNQIVEGKTKIITELDALTGKVVIHSKDDITAGDGKKHDVVPGKGAASTRTTSNVFRLLKICGIPVAFDEQVNDVKFVADRCSMIPLEVVVRRQAYGSCLERNPHFKKGLVFPQLKYELYLKTNGRKWGEYDLVCDDPLIKLTTEGQCELYNPHTSIHGAKPFLTLDDWPLKDQPGVSDQIYQYALQVFLILEKAWSLLRGTLIDFKLEFGLLPDNSVVLADVVDSDSWRVLFEGVHFDKQFYREGGDVHKLLEKYVQAAELTSRFALPKQAMIFWVGSPSDNCQKMFDAYNRYSVPGVELYRVESSMHKAPIQSIQSLNAKLAQVPDSVVIAFIGMSNGAGPALAANCTVPVIAVPANMVDFPEDVWSSLRTPSNVPLMTVTDPSNAVLAGLQILAMRNPAQYAKLRFAQEQRLVNFFTF